MTTAASAKKKTGGGKTDSRVDDYLGKAPEFARPILTKIRGLIHAGCPDVEETIKWGRPTFVYRGKMLCVLSAFKAHCSLGFWQAGVATLIAQDGHGRVEDPSGKFERITSLADLPADAALGRYVTEAVRILDGGEPAKPRVASGGKRAEIPVPADFATMLEGHPAAAAVFAAFSPSHRREYLEWIVGAKREETRARRMATALEWLAEGKTKEWKYQS